MEVKMWRNRQEESRCQGEKKHLVEEETRRRLESRVEKTNRGGMMWGVKGKQRVNERGSRGGEERGGSCFGGGEVMRVRAAAFSSG